MLATMIAAALAIGPASAGDGGEMLMDGNSAIVGWYCEPQHCSSNPRGLRSAVRFDTGAWRAISARLLRSRGSFNVMLNCAVRGTRLRDCRRESDTVGSAADVRLAVRVVRDLRVLAPRDDDGAATRAIVSISHEPGECALCPRTPAPPPPPPPRD